MAFQEENKRVRPSPLMSYIRIYINTLVVIIFIGTVINDKLVSIEDDIVLAKIKLLCYFNLSNKKYKKVINM